MRILKQIFCTKIGWAFVCWCLFTGSLFFNTPEWVQWVFLAYPLCLGLIAVGYGIRNMFKDKKGSFK